LTDQNDEHIHSDTDGEVVNDGHAHRERVLQSVVAEVFTHGENLVHDPRFTMPAKCGAICEFKQVDAKKCARYMEKEFYCENKLDECVVENTQIMMWTRDPLPKL